MLKSIMRVNKSHKHQVCLKSALSHHSLSHCLNIKKPLGNNYILIIMNIFMDLALSGLQ